MATMHFGVVDQNYDNREGNEATTTGAVAQILEDKYHPFEIFYESHETEIAEMIAESMAGTLETLMMGGPKAPDPFAEGTQKVAGMFKDFLSSAEIEEIGAPGIPTKAALARRSLRFKGKKAKNRRPSLIDTGLYQASSTVWIDGLELPIIETGLPDGAS